MNKPKMILVGRAYGKNDSQLSNQEKLNRVMGWVNNYFPFGEPFFQNEQRLKSENYPYPEFFSAGWFYIINGGETKQTVVVAHGHSLSDANKKMEALGLKIEW